jgi:hypothetical protein
MPPELLKVIKMIERVLDRRSINQKFFDMKYVAELVDDSFAAELPEKSISDGLKMAVIKYLSNDYDIRQNGQMIKEVGTPIPAGTRGIVVKKQSVVQLRAQYPNIWAKDANEYIFTVKFKPGGEVQVRDIDIEPLS